MDRNSASPTLSPQASQVTASVIETLALFGNFLICAPLAFRKVSAGKPVRCPALSGAPYPTDGSRPLVEGDNIWIVIACDSRLLDHF